MTRSSLATTLAAYLERANFTADRLANQSGVPKATIVNWLKGRTRQTHDWRGLVRIGGVLALAVEEVDDLVTGAGHAPLRVLMRTHCAPKDQRLFAPWRVQRDTAPAVIAALLQVAYQQLATLPRHDLPPLAPLSPGTHTRLHRNPLFAGRAQELRTVAQP